MKESSMCICASQNTQLVIKQTPTRQKVLSVTQVVKATVVFHIRQNILVLISYSNVKVQ